MVACHATEMAWVGRHQVLRPEKSTLTRRAVIFQNTSTSLPSSSVFGRWRPSIQVPFITILSLNLYSFFPLFFTRKSLDISRSLIMDTLLVSGFCSSITTKRNKHFLVHFFFIVSIKVSLTFWLSQLPITSTKRGPCKISLHQLLFYGHEVLSSEKNLFFFPPSRLAFNTHEFLILVAQLWMTD